MQDIMLDLETLALTPNAVVVAIGAVFFDPYSDELGATYDVRCSDLREQVAAGRYIDPDTVSWWMRQENNAKAMTFAAQDKACSTYYALNGFERFLGPLKDQVRIWGNGAAFDNVVLRSLYCRAFDYEEAPWSYRNDRCFRTLKATVPVNMNTGLAGTAHNALDDAIYQARVAQIIFRKLPAPMARAFA